MTRNDAENAVHRAIREEGRRLTAALIHRLGTQHLELAEDVSQQAMLTALQTWSVNDMPDNPGAWLRRVATNRAIDELRRRQREPVGEMDDEIPDTGQQDEIEEIALPELRLLYLTCNDALSTQDQVILSLNLAAGFTAGEIARLMLRDQRAVAQRLVRLKKKLRESNSLTTLPDIAGQRERDSTILETLYLIFCAGYLPTDGDALVRTDVIREALTLAESLLTQNNGDPATAALCAFFCLQSSRMEARDEEGKLVPLAEQNRAKWDQKLIRRGLAHLQASRCGESVSRFHLEAAIAGAHATAASFEDTPWHEIEMFYRHLAEISGSPVVAVSCAVARHHAGDTDGALDQLLSIRDNESIQRYAPYFAALATIQEASGNLSAAAEAIGQVDQLQANSVVRAFLTNRFLDLHQV